MGLLSGKDLQKGMALADDLLDFKGALLLAKGTVLTERHLLICKMWGVVEADIEGMTSSDIEASEDAVLAGTAAAETVAKRFGHADRNHPAIRALVRLCTLRSIAGKEIDQDNFRESFWFSQEIEDIEKKRPMNIVPAVLIREDIKLSTLPDIYWQILDVISRPNSSAYDIEQVISKDTYLTARLLKIVNSSFYGYQEKIDTLSRAVNVVGTKQLSTLAVGVNVICSFEHIPQNIVNMKMFWKHSILCGLFARILAGYKNIHNAERLFVAGLLHDIGRLVLYNYLPRESLYAVTKARREHQLLNVGERDLFGVDHAAIGGELLAKWQIPPSLKDMVTYHHEPLISSNRMEASLVHLADIMTNAMGIGNSGEVLIPAMNSEAWALTGLSPNVLTPVMDQAEQQLKDVFEFIYPDGKSGKGN
ncbi:MAG: HDOD domain-containing protein [Syntrophales bacterium]|nr:HDOD domain-containing protein [Syntrophales bacterium]